MTEFTLELYYERSADEAIANSTAGELQRLVKCLAPHIQLTVEVLLAKNIERSRFEYGGAPRDIPKQAPSTNVRQSLLITNEDIGFQGLASAGTGCVSRQRMEQKKAAGGDPADIVIHEWIHTLEGIVINGRRVPFADNNKQYEYEHPSSRGKDGEDIWYDWYRFALGG